jgi:mRNA-degrading endonuclease RelE of RelBE toxin-antitoxin system
MSYSVIFHTVAETEFHEACLWYEQRLDGLGDRFTKAVERSLNQISSAPLSYAKKHDSFREAKTEDFPYVIVYKVYEKKKAVLIVAIYHTGRNPRKKYRR